MEIAMAVHLAGQDLVEEAPSDAVAEGAVAADDVTEFAVRRPLHQDPKLGPRHLRDGVRRAGHLWLRLLVAPVVGANGVARNSPEDELAVELFSSEAARFELLHLLKNKGLVSGTQNLFHGHPGIPRDLDEDRARGVEEGDAGADGMLLCHLGVSKSLSGNEERV
ncbi:hypothetical protein L596_008544 [Steinernema carpocapsae]|uniref:Uncharacterized protein n=1 Tax=Steinernema carpocapsae TaxID=34508 RepID=A0A4U5PCX0_STECR|nr:hypothetical protein L596_008544 [Steinernema carpocapsae]